MMNANNTLVVVTRWYGGIHLGGDRWKHINNAARNSIEAGTNEEQSQEQKNNTKSKSNNRGKHSKDKKH
jgi:putative IMPACT (imprinted ancient) family translation regulator